VAALRRHKLAVAGLVVLTLMVLMVAARSAGLEDPDQRHRLQRPPADADRAPIPSAPTTSARTSRAACSTAGRISLAVGLAAMLMAMLVGVTIGAIAGISRGAGRRGADVARRPVSCRCRRFRCC
jgi:peptide/nickel transport system permease protein